MQRSNIVIKTPQEIEKIYDSCKIAAIVMQRTLGFIHPFIATERVDKFIDSQIKSFHAAPSFKGFEGYKYSSCISVNDEVVHGIPGSRKIKRSDLLSIDLGVYYRGFHSDLCTTVEMPDAKMEDGNWRMSGRNWKIENGRLIITGGKQKRFLEAGIFALDSAINMCKPGNRLGDISHAIQSIIEDYGYNVVRDLVGHGIGSSLHEEPQIPCFGKKGTGLKLSEGMVIAVEVMYTKGSQLLNIKEDGWTFATKDKSLSAMFEHTVAITKEGPQVLTKL